MYQRDMCGDNNQTRARTRARVLTAASPVAAEARPFIYFTRRVMSYREAPFAFDDPHVTLS